MESQNKLSRILDNFRESFLDDLPARLKETEIIIARAQMHNQWKSSSADFFTHIHGIKGSAVTFGYHALAMACHQLEEYIVSKADAEIPPLHFFEIVAGYMSACDEALKEMRENSETFERTERRLATLRVTAFEQQFSVALVFNSSSLMGICQDIAASYNGRVATYPDSLTALQGCLSDPCDLLMVTAQSYPLAGEALIAALKMSPRTRIPRTVLISSSPQKYSQAKRQYDPDYVVIRDPSFASNLQRIVASVHEQYRSERS